MASPPASDDDANLALVKEHVARNGHRTFGEPKGLLPYPWLLPSGFYSQLWCWDAVFMGAGTLRTLPALGAHLAGSMKNYFFHTNADGDVPGCITPTVFSPTLRHAKPVIVWGAYLAAKATGDFAGFQPFRDKMEATLRYWGSGRRYDAETGLHVWVRGG